MHSWRVLILPYLEQRQLFEQYDFSEPWDGPNNSKLAAQMPKVYAFHGEYKPGLTTTNYLAVVGVQTMWPGNQPRQTADVTDSTDSTILVVENAGQGIHWTEPRDLDFATMSFAVNSPNGISSKYLEPAVVMADGTLRKLQENISPEVLQAMLTANAGEEVREDAGGWTLLGDGRDRLK
jgi:hypothetical protein